MKALIALAMALALASCATEPPYQPATSSSGFGYSDQRLEQNRFRVTFNGNSVTDRNEVEDFLLYRSAELTLQNGFDYFIVADRDTDRKRRYDDFTTSTPVTFVRYYYSARYGWLPFYDTVWRNDTYLREVTRYRSTAEVTMYKGKKPADDPRAFDARDVQTNLAGKVAPPQPGG